MTKEDVYDEKIQPLMAEILSICKDHKIAMLASFSIPNEEDEDLMCTSALLTDEFEPCESQLAALRAIRGAPQAMAITITSKKP